MHDAERGAEQAMLVQVQDTVIHLLPQTAAATVVVGLELQGRHVGKAKLTIHDALPFVLKINGPVQRKEATAVGAIR